MIDPNETSQISVDDQGNIYENEPVEGIPETGEPIYKSFLNWE